MNDKQSTLNWLTAEPVVASARRPASLYIGKVLKNFNTVVKTILKNIVGLSLFLRQQSFYVDQLVSHLVLFPFSLLPVT